MGAAQELAAVLAACDDALARVLRTEPATIWLLGAGSATQSFAGGTTGSFAGYGVDHRVVLGGGRPGLPRLPLSLTVGAWLLARSGFRGQVGAMSVAPDAADDVLSGLAGRLEASGPGLALVVCGDGSGRTARGTPGAAEAEVLAVESAVAAAMAGGDPAALVALDPQDGADLGISGTQPWRLAGMVAAGTAYDAVLHARQAPLEVTYLVASWWAR